MRAAVAPMRALSVRAVACLVVVLIEGPSVGLWSEEAGFRGFRGGAGRNRTVRASVGVGSRRGVSGGGGVYGGEHGKGVEKASLGREPGGWVHALMLTTSSPGFAPRVRCVGVSPRQEVNC